MKKLKKSVLFYTILYAILLYTLYLILEKFNLMFRQWVNIISFIIIGSGCIIGIGQVIFSINKKWLKIVLGIIFVISLVIIGPFVYIFPILAYKPEHVVYKNDEKYVAYVIAFHMTSKSMRRSRTSRITIRSVLRGVRVIMHTITCRSPAISPPSQTVAPSSISRSSTR